MSQSKRIMFACVAVVLSMGLVVGLVLSLDLYLHKRFGKVAGLNIRGYRGPVVKQKRPDEQRIVVLGGSTALGYGVAPEESFPAFLERMLNERRRQEGRGPVSIVNLAYNTEGAYAYQYNLMYFDYLDYDLALLYTGYNDLGAEPNTFVLRRQSPIFRLTGYMPIFPLVFREKAMALRYGGNLEAAYRNEKTVFRPNLAERATASALEAAASVSESLERQLGRLSKDLEEGIVPVVGPCPPRWTHYCHQVSLAVSQVLQRGRYAMVVTQPYTSDGHMEQQQAMVGMLQATFGDHPRLRHVNLGRAVDLSDSDIAYDGLHLTAEGNEQIARHLMPSIVEVLEDAR